MRVWQRIRNAFLYVSASARNRRSDTGIVQRHTNTNTVASLALVLKFPVIGSREGHYNYNVV